MSVTRALSAGTLRTLALFGRFVVALVVIALMIQVIGPATGRTPQVIAILVLCLALAVLFGGGALAAPAITVALGGGLYLWARLLAVPDRWIQPGFVQALSLAIVVFGMFATVAVVLRKRRKAADPG